MLTKHSIQKFFILLIFSSIVFSPFMAHGQITETPDQKQTRLEAELAQVEAEQRETQKVLSAAQNQSSSLKRDILILDTKIKAAELNIRAKNLLIESLGKDINKKQETIEGLLERIEKGQETLAQIMRKTNEVDTVTLPEIILSNENLTHVFYDLDSFESVQLSLQKTFEEIRTVKSQTETEKDALDKRKGQEQDARLTIQQEKRNIANDQIEKQRLLNISKNNEQTYSQVLAEKQRKAAQIRAALFALRDTAAIPFGDALKYANEAAKMTGIRPAFLLAILTQESSLGANVGSCYLVDTKTGTGSGVKTGNTIKKVMNPTRDVPPFLTITKELGLDHTKTLVSCPQSVGWGGAMGPAQFIPSTWMLFKERIAKAVGTSIPNPWSPKDAFMASAIYLTDLGAINGSYNGEQNAACRYYSGRSCSSSSLIKSYGTSVMTKANNIQKNMIDPLQGL